MSWSYESSTGRMTKEGVGILATGYAGNGPGKNDPALQNVHNVGPLPEGWYTIGEPRDMPVLGPYALPLIPDADNEMWNRGEFFCHGERKEGPIGLASDGCIVLPLFARERLWQSGDHRLQVVAELEMTA
jgi:hypothetical protein